MTIVHHLRGGDKPGAHANSTVLDLPTALSSYPDSGYVLYTRSSTWSGAGTGKSLLEMKACSADVMLQQIVGQYCEQLFYRVESGSVYRSRIMLERAAKFAEQKGCVLVAPDLTRFIRPDVYYTLPRGKGLNEARKAALPTQEEYEKLRELTLGVPLATLVDPKATWQERHSCATKLRQNAGRPPGRKR